VESLREVLSEHGIAYLVLEQCNKPETYIPEMEELGFDCSTVISRRAGRELLYIVKLSRRKR